MTAVNVSDEMLQKAMRLARTDSPQEAVMKALEEFTQRHSQAELIEYLGTFDDFMTPEELDEMRSME